MDLNTYHIFGKVIKFPTYIYKDIENIPQFAGVMIKNTALPDDFRMGTLI